MFSMYRTLRHRSFALLWVGQTIRAWAIVCTRSHWHGGCSRGPGPPSLGAALPFLIKEHLQADVGVLGLFYSFNSLGAVLGALWIGHYTVIRRRGLKIYAPWLLLAGMVALMGLARSTAIVLGAGVVIGACNSILGLVWLNALQDRVSRDRLGRVSSIDYLGSSLLEPVGLAVGGWATEWIGPAPVFVVGGILQAAILAAGLAHPEVRKLD